MNIIRKFIIVDVQTGHTRNWEDSQAMSPRKWLQRTACEKAKFKNNWTQLSYAPDLFHRASSLMYFEPAWYRGQFFIVPYLAWWRTRMSWNDNDEGSSLSCLANLTSCWSSLLSDALPSATWLLPISLKSLRSFDFVGSAWHRINLACKRSAIVRASSKRSPADSISSKICDAKAGLPDKRWALARAVNWMKRGVTPKLEMNMFHKFSTRLQSCTAPATLINEPSTTSLRVNWSTETASHNISSTVCCRPFCSNRESSAVCEIMFFEYPFFLDHAKTSMPHWNARGPIAKQSFHAEPCAAWTFVSFTGGGKLRQVCLARVRALRCFAVSVASESYLLFRFFKQEDKASMKILDSVKPILRLLFWHRKSCTSSSVSHQFLALQVCMAAPNTLESTCDFLQAWCKCSINSFGLLEALSFSRQGVNLGFRSQEELLSRLDGDVRKFCCWPCLRPVKDSKLWAGLLTARFLMPKFTWCGFVWGPRFWWNNDMLGQRWWLRSSCFPCISNLGISQCRSKAHHMRHPVSTRWLSMFTGFLRPSAVLGPHGLYLHTPCKWQQQRPHATYF